MVICHICMNGPYNEGWNYQENILPKYHSKMGYKVVQIVTPYEWEGTEQIVSTDLHYTNELGVEIYRLKVKKGLIGGTRLNRYPELKGLLKMVKPDIIFIHDVQFMDAPVVAKYLKNNPNCIAYADNHSDFSNSARNWISKNILHKVLWKHMAQVLNPYIRKFYGVLPARVDFLVDVYGLPKEKCELLVMGADDEYVNCLTSETKIQMRKKYDVKEKEFLIVTGGKIDLAKTQTLLLMEAVKELNNVKLLVFGSVAEEIRKEFDALCDGEKVKYIGWVNGNESYPLFYSADLVAFPGRHSVYWEQVAAMGIPMLIKYWDGTTHVDMGGNVMYLYNDSCEEITERIRDIMDPIKYRHMQEIASTNKDTFLYSNIARCSIS